MAEHGENIQFMKNMGLSSLPQVAELSGTFVHETCTHLFSQRPQ